MMKYWYFFAMLIFSCSPKNDPRKLFADYDSDFKKMNISFYSFAYKDNLQETPSLDNLTRLKDFYTKYLLQAKEYDRKGMQINDKINFDHLLYIIDYELKRIDLETNFKRASEPIPDGGLFHLQNHENWYKLYSQFYTGTLLTPEELMFFGENEVKRVNENISRIKKKMGYNNNDPAFYKSLKDDQFFLTDTNTIVKLYRQKEAVVRKNLSKLFEDTIVPPLSIRTWPFATTMMPPAIYQSTLLSFDYNFSSLKHNIRAMDWVFNHEGIPGHHYQFSIRDKNNKNKPAFVSNYFYPGTAEGWACYTEYLGKDLGQYITPPEELGKWEWDLVRSARIVLDVGIHYYGWDKEKALSYWKQNIKGQDEIAEREITRVTNWPAQALSYKVGAMKIEALKKSLKVDSATIKKFHSAILFFSSEPWEVTEQNIEKVFSGKIANNK